MPISAFRSAGNTADYNFVDVSMPINFSLNDTCITDDYMFICADGNNLYRLPKDDSDNSGKLLSPIGTDDMLSGANYNERIFIGSFNGGVEWSDDNGDTFTKGIGVPASSCYGLAASEDNIVALMGSGSTYWYSIDNGVNWSSGSFPGSYSNGPERVKYLNGDFYVTGDASGNYYKSSDGVTWSSIAGPGGSVSIRSFEYHNNTLYIAYSNGNVYKGNDLMTAAYRDDTGASGLTALSMRVFNNRLYVGYNWGSKGLVGVELNADILSPAGFDFDNSSFDVLTWMQEFNGALYFARGSDLMRSMVNK